MHDVKFSATGDQLLFVAHDATVSVVDSTKGNKLITFISKDLPYRCCAWLSPSTIVVAGEESFLLFGFCFLYLFFFFFCRRGATPVICIAVLHDGE